MKVINHSKALLSLFEFSGFLKCSIHKVFNSGFVGVIHIRSYSNNLFKYFDRKKFQPLYEFFFGICSEYSNDTLGF